jgi:ankyrin repeat protein
MRTTTISLLLVTLAVVGCRGRTADTSDVTAALHRAAQKGDLAQVQSLVAGGADIEARGKDGFTPLHTATNYGQAGVIEFLTGGTPLHIAAWQGRVDIVRLLIAAGADVNAGRDRGRTPLYDAGHVLGGQGEEDVVKILLAHGAQILSGNTRENEELLCFGVEHGMRDLVEKVLGAGATPNAMGCTSGRSVLGEAVARGDKEIAELLIAHGADVDRKDALGMTPLHYARRWSKDVAELLLAKGADVNTTGAFRHAVVADEKEIVELFLAHGADVNAKDRTGKTALDEAIALGHRDIVELLKKHGASQRN